MLYNYRHAQLYFAERGIKPSNLGYRYLLAGIEMMSVTPGRFSNVGELYAAVGERFGRNSTSVERAIRYTLRPLGTTNKAFITRMAEDLIYDGPAWPFPGPRP